MNRSIAPLLFIFFSICQVSAVLGSQLCGDERLRGLSLSTQSFYRALENSLNDAEFKKAFFENMKTDYAPSGISAEKFSAIFSDCNPKTVSDLETSFKQPVLFSAKESKENEVQFSLYKGHIFIDAFFQLSRGDFKRQPWVEWIPNQNRLELHSSGADLQLLQSVADSKIYRGASRKEFELLRFTKRFYFGRLSTREISSSVQLLEEVTKSWQLSSQNLLSLKRLISDLPRLSELTKEQKKDSAQFVLSLVSRSGVMMTTPQKEVAAHWAFIVKNQNDDKVVIEFDQSRSPLDRQILRGMYAGIEYGYLEVGLISADARLHFLEGLKEIPYEESDARREFPNLK